MSVLGLEDSRLSIFVFPKNSCKGVGTEGPGLLLQLFIAQGCLLSIDYGLRFGPDSICQAVHAHVLIQPESLPFWDLRSSVRALQTAQAGHMMCSHCTLLCWPSLFICLFNCFLECSSLCAASFSPLL